MKKTCKICKNEFDYSMFGNHPETSDKKKNFCRICDNAKQRIKRKESGNAITRRYEKTKKGFLVRAYRNMLSRVCGVQKSKYHLYSGLDIMPKEVFYEWSLSNEDFNRLFESWENSGHERKLTPSIDRINSYLGYTIDNSRWITFSLNCSLGARSIKKELPNY